MTGFRGQKFDFTGSDNGWYAVVSDLPNVHLNMRVTSPVSSVPEITYITGISLVTMDADGMHHTVTVSVTDPHSLESACPVGMSPCLADGALTVVTDGEEVFLAPGEVTLAPGVAISAVNLPGPCRSFGFENYWERKKLELGGQAGRRLNSINTMEDMSKWIMSDPTATNMAECAEYVAHATAFGEIGLFDHQSEHSSFQIISPTLNIRLSHGRLHQVPRRDPTDQFDLPDHLTWQMNLAIDHSELSLDATGILGETLVPTVGVSGAPIMKGMDAIRGTQDDCKYSKSSNNYTGKRSQ